MNYAMYSNPETCQTDFFFLYCLSLTFYQYLKCDLSLAFQSGWLIRRLHWKVAGLVKRQKTAIENVIFVVINWVSWKCILPNNCTKEAIILAVWKRWQGHSYVCIKLILIILKRPNNQGTTLWILFVALSHFSTMYSKPMEHNLFSFHFIFFLIFYLIRVIS